MARPLRVSIEAFAHEIQEDLPRLIQEYPTGVYFSALQNEYGESATRILKASQILVSKHSIKLMQAASKAHYIVPFDYVEPVPLIELTDLQRRLVIYLARLCKDHNTTLVKTDYSQLARIMECSYGGLHTCINRVVALGYLMIEQPSVAGRQSHLVLRVTQTLMDKLANYLDS